MSLICRSVIEILTRSAAPVDPELAAEVSISGLPLAAVNGDARREEGFGADGRDNPRSARRKNALKKTAFIEQRGFGFVKLLKTGKLRISE